MPRSDVMIYGAYGYTGALIARRAVQRGHQPVLAGRNADKLRALARELGLRHVQVDLHDRAALVRALSEVSIVCHAAGPFVFTAELMQAACLAARTSYLDITGEIPVFEASFRNHAAARAAGIAIISGLGFDVVPSDCLARFVAERVPDARRLEIAFKTNGRPSAGTVRASLEGIARGNFVRRAGELVRVPFGAGLREVPFLGESQTALPIPWGDLVTAFHTTGVPDIDTYVAIPSSAASVLARAPALDSWLLPALSWVLQRPALKRILLGAVDVSVGEPSARARALGHAELWARASDQQGRSAEAWLTTCDGYAFTEQSVVLAVERLLAEPRAGTFTPALAFGADFALAISGTRRHERREL